MTTAKYTDDNVAFDAALLIEDIARVTNTNPAHYRADHPIVWADGRWVITYAVPTSTRTTVAGFTGDNDTAIAAIQAVRDALAFVEDVRG
jgi:hypothetical protein